MARVKGPLFSESATGKLGTDLLFRGGKSGTHVYALKPRSLATENTPSDAQLEVRERYSAAAQTWRDLDPSERAAWNAQAHADSRNVHGWALFLEAFEYNSVPDIMTWNDGLSTWNSGQRWG